MEPRPVRENTKMLEIIAILVYLSRLVALAHSRGRSWAWALGGLAVWLAADAVGWALSPHDHLVASVIALPLALLGAALYYGLVHELDPVEQPTTYGRGDNFPCPCCGSLQTEDRAGHLACHACGSAFGRV
jgi:hypothetical protein